MKNYLSIHDLPSIKDTVAEAIALKKNPLQFQDLGKNKTIGLLLFFNNSSAYAFEYAESGLEFGHGAHRHEFWFGGMAVGV